MKPKLLNPLLLLTLVFFSFSLMGTLVITQLLHPRSQALANKLDLNIYGIPDLNWLMPYPRVPLELLVALAVIFSIIVILWLVPTIRAKFSGVLVIFTTILSLINLVIFILAAVGAWMYSHYVSTDLSLRMHAYERVINDYALESVLRDKLDTLDAINRHLYGTYIVTLESPDALEKGEREERIESYIQALKKAHDPAITKKLLSTLAQFEGSEIEHEDEDLIVLNATQDISGQKFTNTSEALDWISSQSDGNGWEAIPIIVQRYEEPLPIK